MATRCRLPSLLRSLGGAAGNRAVLGPVRDLTSTPGLTLALVDLALIASVITYLASNQRPTSGARTRPDDRQQGDKHFGRGVLGSRNCSIGIQACDNPRERVPKG